MPAARIAPTTAPQAAAVINVQVESFDDWKAVFDDHGAARARAGIVASQVNRAVDDPRHVTVFLTAKSFETLGAFLASAERADAMKRAGVIDAPRVSFVVPVDEQVLADRRLAGAMLRHHVVDFDVWKAGFDARAGARADAGIVGYGVCRAKDDPNEVFVYLQSESVEALRRFTSSADLKAAMARGGVQGAPLVALVESYPFTR